MVISLRQRLIVYLFVGIEQDLSVLDAYFQIGAHEKNIDFLIHIHITYFSKACVSIYIVINGFKYLQKK